MVISSIGFAFRIGHWSLVWTIGPLVNLAVAYGQEYDRIDSSSHNGDLVMVTQNSNPIQLTKADGIYQLTYFGHPTGYIGPIKVKSRDRHHWRAVSVHGEVKHCYSLESARQWLLAAYH